VCTTCALIVDGDGPDLPQCRGVMPASRAYSGLIESCCHIVMRALVAGIHVFLAGSHSCPSKMQPLTTECSSAIGGADSSRGSDGVFSIEVRFAATERGPDVTVAALGREDPAVNRLPILTPRIASSENVTQVAPLELAIRHSRNSEISKRAR
jgi:hypothetical protein